MKPKPLACTESLCTWLKELAFLGHTLSLGVERLRHDAEVIRASIPPSSRRDNAVLKELTKGFTHSESLQRGFSPDQLIDIAPQIHSHSLNRLLLFETCAAYERWATEMGSTLVLPTTLQQQLKRKRTPFTYEDVARALQFPSTAEVLVAGLAKVAPNNQPPGLTPLRNEFSKAIRRAIIKVNKLQDDPNARRFRVNVHFRTLLRKYLTIYRAHKELRNSLVHSAMQVDSKFQRARAAYDNIKPESIGLQELPQLIPVNIGDTAVVTLRGVFGLIKVVEHIARIVDGYAN